MALSDHIIFSDIHVHYAISFIDIENSTALVSHFSGREVDLFYSIFLNEILSKTANSCVFETAITNFEVNNGIF